MKTASEHGSAQIFEFPLRGRFAINTLQNEQAAASLRGQKVANVSFGGAWYHDEAIRDAEPTRN